MNISDVESGSDLEEFADRLMEQALDFALGEDLGERGEDLTTDAIVDAGVQAEADVILKEPATIAGIDVFRRIMRRLSPDIEVTELVADGERVEKVPQRIIKLAGPAAPILRGERLALNVLQRMCGVASLTRRFVEAAGNIEILDTRKTTPCLRAFEKLAVRIGGGTNHRFGLFDAVLIKENHIAAAGSITAAVEAVRSAHGAVEIEVETQDLDEVEEALACRVDIILLDNMTPEAVLASTKTLKGRCKVEVSGGITLDNIGSYIIDGVDRISVGALTHSAKAIDISLDLELIAQN